MAGSCFFMQKTMCALPSLLSAGGTELQIRGHTVLLKQDIPLGFKIASCDIAADESIVKYGVSIGSATRDIVRGDLVHLHNMKSDYLPTYTLDRGDSHAP